MSGIELDVFDRALAGEKCWIRDADGVRHRLPMQRWLGLSGTDRRADLALTECCDGPTVDLGCGPGRLVAALLRRGVLALGVDISPTALAITRFRGAPALRRDLFGPLPGTGRWAYALLADGNIGIGGDPERILRRTAALLMPGGVAVVEFGRPGTGSVTRQLRVESRTHVGCWFPWATVSIDHAADLARNTGFRVVDTVEVGGRHIAWLRSRRASRAVVRARPARSGASEVA
ncbi:methyltransferase domain-containing protein [Nocardia brasiliensis]|uniref:methyltransferase domain-containing protein n=1 Tax=Nocardia brasiliensis TaxID=37326 RepID=UPI001895B781|nr:class I SAM-dependent methyltransferase [Nocardia brasiliensis]MBF6544645.1 SAM-dependent methyltransferase [Nocardia brasiliensis]